MPRFQQADLAHAACFIDTTLLSVARNRVHDFEKRLARRLLMTRDRRHCHITAKILS